jgi:hypothetical protein
MTESKSTKELTIYGDVVLTSIVKSDTAISFETKWVLLSAYQKLENEVIILNTAHDLRVARINQLEKQIAEANKILDEIEPDYELYKHWQTDFKKLREALK